MKTISGLWPSRLRLWLGLFFAALWSVSSFAADPAVLRQAPDYYLPLAKHIDVFVDETAALKVDDVAQSASRFSPVKTKYAAFGLTSGRVWVRGRLVNESENAGIWRLDINRQYYQELDIYLLRAGRTPKHILRATDQDSFSKRKIPDRMLGVDIDIGANETVDFYIGYRSTSTTYMPLGIGTPQRTMQLHNQENTLNWIFNGALLAMIIFALLMIPVIGWRLGLSFSLYIFAGLSYVFQADGYLFQYFWPDRPELNDPLNLSLMLAMSGFGLIFARVFFKFKKHAPVFDKIILGVIVASLFFALMSIPFIDVKWLMVTAYAVVPLGSLAQLCAGIVAIRGKLLGSWPYFIGAFIVFTSILYAIIAHVMPGHFNLDYTLDYGHFALLAECIAFAAAIVIRLLGIRRERDAALKAELISAQEKLRLSSELQKSQKDYIHARKMSDIRRNQLSSISHDLQQSLASLRGALGTIGGADEGARAQMYKAFDYLETLARDQITAGKSDSLTAYMGGAPETFPVRAILDNVREMFKAEAEDKGLEFRYRPIDANITCDPIALMRAVNNLVSNAIKHTDRGAILLAARRRAGRLRLEVWDTGSGMGAKELKRVMQRYEKGGGSEGSGLGLAIVTEISEALNLDFELRSNPERGSSAFLYLPIA